MGLVDAEIHSDIDEYNKLIQRHRAIEKMVLDNIMRVIGVEDE